MACTCDYSYTCPECQARIDIELEKQERKEKQEQAEERMRSIEENIQRLTLLVEALLQELRSNK